MKRKHPAWWAYLDDTGVVRIRKYISDWEIDKCEQMPFCKGIFGPFTAVNYQDARFKIARFLKNAEYYEKKTTQ